MITKYRCLECNWVGREPEQYLSDDLPSCPDCRAEVEEFRTQSAEERWAEQDASHEEFKAYHALPAGERERLLAVAEARLDAIKALRNKSALEALATLKEMDAQSERALAINAETYRLLNRALDGIALLARGGV